MILKSLSFRLVVPTILLSILLLIVCVISGVLLYEQQAIPAEILVENVRSNLVAHDLENTLIDLISLLHDHNRKVGALHNKIDSLLVEATSLADKEEEQRGVRELRAAFQKYRELWDSPSSSRATPDDRYTACIRILDQEMLPICNHLQEFNSRQIEASASAHRATVRWMALGLAGLSCVGALGGLALGYRVSRTLQHSMYHLSVHIRDAAGKLGQDLPAVALEDPADLTRLHEPMQSIVHEIEQVLEKLRQREREVLRADQLAAVGQLAAGVAHELRNPLTSIKLLVQTNREEAEARGLPSEDLGIIELEIRRMERCLQTFLDFARPPRLERRQLNLSKSVDRALALVSGRARKQQVECVFHAPASPITVEADHEQIQQLLVNLLLNALDVMPRGGKLEVDLRDAGDELELRVCDNGPGISPELFPRLFEPFVSSKETGLGLGLVLSRRIAEEHGGHLEGENRPGGGACFTLQLPLGARV